MMEDSALRLRLRTQALVRDELGHASWQVATTTKVVPASRTAIIICDMWDDHWSRGAARRVAEMAPRLNSVLNIARELGVSILHAPSGTMDVYADTPARQHMRDLQGPDLPPLLDHDDPPLPVDDSDGGSDTGEPASYRAWTRQHAAIGIDQERDGISDDGAEVYHFLKRHGIEQVLVTGVHTNMCVLRRPFAIKALVRRSVPVALVRDLTDALYNPALRPYVSQAEGTRLVIEYIEKFWCPSVESADLTAVAGQ